MRNLESTGNVQSPKLNKRTESAKSMQKDTPTAEGIENQKCATRTMRKESANRKVWRMQRNGRDGTVTQAREKHRRSVGT